MKPEELNDYTIKEVIIALINGLEESTGRTIWRHSHDSNQLVMNTMNAINAGCPSLTTKAGYIWEAIQLGLNKEKLIESYPDTLSLEQIKGFSIGRATVNIEYLKKGEVYLYKPVHQQGKAPAFKLTYIPNRNAYYHYPISYLNFVSYDTELSLSEKAKIYQTLVHITKNKE